MTDASKGYRNVREGNGYNGLGSVFLQPTEHALDSSGHEILILILI